MRLLDYKNLFLSLCIVQLFPLGEGRPRRKRTVSEVQLMHDLGELKQAQERRRWLQMRLRGIHGEEAGATRRTPDLSNMTPEEIQFALNLLEQLLKSKHS
ncbi:parathyroid hormone 1a [Clinocottus analis]|uniref:parathyroid hormone 1a n=1 Tax=Clinocottus analis TaxID=304258 RepID=UPI0035C089AC